VGKDLGGRNVKKKKKGITEREKNDATRGSTAFSVFKLLSIFQRLLPFLGLAPAGSVQARAAADNTVQ
jgi:hypothetical protein